MALPQPETLVLSTRFATSLRLQISLQVNGEPRKQHLTNWESLIGRLTKCAQDMIRLGSQRRRNIIIDQVSLF